MLVRAHAKCPLFVLDFNKKNHMSTKFNKQPTHTKLKKNPHGMSCYVASRWTDRRADRRKEAQRTDGKFENAMSRFLQPLFNAPTINKTDNLGDFEYSF